MYAISSGATLQTLLHHFGTSILPLFALLHLLPHKILLIILFYVIVKSMFHQVECILLTVESNFLQLGVAYYYNKHLVEPIIGVDLIAMAFIIFNK